MNHNPNPPPASTHYPPLPPKRRNYVRYLRSRVKVQFHRKPPLGWIYDKTNGIYVFPRDEQGNLMLDTKCWRGMLTTCLRIHFPNLLDRDPNLMRNVRISDVSLYLPHPDYHPAFGNAYEQLPLGSEVEAIFSYPEEGMSLSEFTKVISVCGSEIGWSPIHALDGYGRFIATVLDDEPLSRE